MCESTPHATRRKDSKELGGTEHGYLALRISPKLFGEPVIDFTLILEIRSSDLTEQPNRRRFFGRHVLCALITRRAKCPEVAGLVFAPK
jgi:hypothetical protein